MSTNTDAVANTVMTLGPQVPFTEAFIGTVAANVVAAGTIFKSNNSWVASPNQEYVLILQTDGNLCQYQVIGNPPAPLAPGVSFNGQVLWQTTTQGNQNDYCLVQQSDGNFCVYPAGGGTALWASNKLGNPSGLFVQDDSNIVVYQNINLWSRF